jgi:glutamate-1-semialdehyde 2,1-aminomutase
MQVAFSKQPVKDERVGLRADRLRARAVMLELLRLGVFLNPMGTKLYLSLAHDDSACDEFAEHFATALAQTQRAP